MNLIVVESPTKAKTLSKFLGKDYNVISSYGHIRDLPRTVLGVDTENNFKPKYVTSNKKAAKKLKKSISKKDDLILATDEDREGEAISWHILQIIRSRFKNKDYQRITFHEITKQAILESLKNPRKIDKDLVNAQQARRVLDRLVGYKLSPFLWKKVCKGLSAGRVQSVALRLICQREKEIKKFEPDEYWTIVASLFKPKTKKPDPFTAKLIKKNNKKIGKLDIKNKEQTQKIVSQLKKAQYEISKIKKKERKRNPYPPYTTSGLQQDASHRLHFSAKQTMTLAQKLYEKGSITYHRTDSTNLSKLFLGAAKDYIKKEFDDSYLKTRQFKTKSKSAQEAHEAIRPTKVKKEKVRGKNLNKLYQLIWQRALASQMTPAKLIRQSIDIKAGKFTLRASGQKIKFDGFLKVYPLKISENVLPSLSKGDNLNLKKIIPKQHFTKPPARYSEATLVKKLKEEDIGRPSTYAPTLSTVQNRGYVKKIKGRLHPQEIGQTVNKILVTHFPKIVDLKFTAEMENKLDKIAAGKKKWQPIIKKFYEPFEKRLEKKYEEVDKVVEKTDKKCPECGSPLLIRFSKYGKFLACSAFPECKYSEPLDKDKRPKPKKIGLKCPKCKKGDIVERYTRKNNKKFWGCSRFPKCKFATWDDPKEDSKKA